MTRARLSKRVSDADAIRLFAATHITQVRRKRNGEIVAVKHAMFGWISPKAYYMAQEFHQALPKLIEGGYRLKQAIYGISLQVLGTDIEIPAGEGLFIAEAIKMFLSLKDGNDIEALKWAATIALPFGDILALWILIHESLNLLHPPVKRPPIIGPIRPPIQPLGHITEHGRH